MFPSSEALVGWVGRHILPHEPSLRAWLSRAFPGADADDIVQETYCRLATLDSFDHITDPRRYLFRSARNVVLEQVRRSRVISIEAASGLGELEMAADEDTSSPERIVAARRSLARVEQLINGLPDRARRVFRLRKLDGLSQREIAQQLGLTEAVVENEVARGLRRILHAMTQEERGEMPTRSKRGRAHGPRTSNGD
jgi:RNA polymerase sigma factor (sigma-70 family)